MPQRLVATGRLAAGSGLMVYLQTRLPQGLLSYDISDDDESAARSQTVGGRCGGATLRPALLSIFATRIHRTLFCSRSDAADRIRPRGSAGHAVPDGHMRSRRTAGGHAARFPRLPDMLPQRPLSSKHARRHNDPTTLAHVLRLYQHLIDEPY